MAKNSAIGWCDDTWNFAVGCTKLKHSPGCDGCYACATANVRQHNPNAKVSSVFLGTIRRGPGGADWNGHINIIEDRLHDPLRMRKPRKIFVNSLSDVFHPGVPLDVLAHAFAVMVACPHHVFQVLTKREVRMREVLRSESFWRAVAEHLRGLWNLNQAPAPLNLVPPWIWIVVSAENQELADQRIPVLLDTPATTRGVSLEPLIGPITLHPEWVTGRPRLDWMIVGGETGPKARPMHPAWARALRDQAVSAGIPLFFKQWGDLLPVPVVDAPGMVGDRAYRDPQHGGLTSPTIRTPGPSGTHRSSTTRLMEPGERTTHRVMLDRDTVAVRVGVKAAGNLLDGQRWEQFPAATPSPAHGQATSPVITAP